MVLLLGGNALRQQAVADAHAIAAATGCRVLAENFCQRIERGAGRFSVTRVPYLIDRALEVYAGAKHVVRIGAVHPVIFFAYPGKPQSPVPEDAKQYVLSLPDGDQPHDEHGFRGIVRLTSFWCLGFSLFVALATFVGGRYFIDFISTNDAVRAYALAYLPYAALTPLLGALAFEFDGVYIGATWTREVRNLMRRIWAAVVRASAPLNA